MSGSTDDNYLGELQESSLMDIINRAFETPNGKKEINLSNYYV